MLNFFDRVVYVNLDHRKDRRKIVENAFTQQGIKKYERFPGILYIEHDSPNKGCTGINLSFYNILKDTLDKGYKNVWLFEDDPLFLYSPKETKNLMRFAIKELPEEWAIFYPHVNLRSVPIYYSEHLIRLTKGNTSQSSWCINRWIIPKILELQENFGPHHIIDNLVAHVIHPNYPCFATIPMLLTQVSGYSDIMCGSTQFDGIGGYGMANRYTKNIKKMKMGQTI